MIHPFQVSIDVSDKDALIECDGKHHCWRRIVVYADTAEKAALEAYKQLLILDSETVTQLQDIIDDLQVIIQDTDITSDICWQLMEVQDKLIVLKQDITTKESETSAHVQTSIIQP
jgi:hypothetical protein